MTNVTPCVPAGHTSVGPQGGGVFSCCLLWWRVWCAVIGFPPSLTIPIYQAEKWSLELVGWCGGVVCSVGLNDGVGALLRLDAVAKYICPAPMRGLGSIGACFGVVCSDRLPSLPYNPNLSGWEVVSGAGGVVCLKCIAMS